MANWVARNSDHRWMVKGYGDPALILSQPAAYTLVPVPGNDTPDPRTEIWDDTVPSKKRAATAPEISAYDAETLDARSQMTSRQKDTLATCALIVRARGIATWNGMTTQQKIDAAFAEADVWKNLRIFAETNL